MVADFVPGNIVQIELKDFLTYDHVIFKCHPNLNLICGPNGSGKSSLVCAIVLGLAGRPEMLGRAKDIKSFVKAGKLNGEVHITLQQQRGTTKISRYFNNKSNTTTFMQDNCKVTKGVITDLVAGLNIKLDNLCQVLPQEKVGHFSQLSMKERLKETEFIIGGEELVKLHADVVDQLKNTSNLDGELVTKRSKLSNLKEQNHLLENQVEFFRQSEQMKLEHAAMKLAYNDTLYQESNESLVQLQADEQIVSTELAGVRNRTAAYQTQTNKLKEAVESATDIAAKHSVQLSDFLKKMRKSLDKIDLFEEKITDALSNIKNIHDKDKEAIAQIQQDTQTIANLKIQLERHLEQTPQLQSQQQALHSEADALVEQSMVLDDKSLEIQSRISILTNKSSQIRRNKQNDELELRKCDQIKDRRLDLIRRQNADVIVAYNYIQKNAHNFRGTVLGPILLEMSVEPKYATPVESLLGRNLLIFLCDEPSDYELLLKEFTDRLGLKVDVKIVSTNQPSPNDTQFAQYGFDLLLSSVVTCPLLVSQYLKNDFDFHKIPLKSDGQLANYDRCRAMYPRFILSNQCHMTQRSKYGNNALSTKSFTMNNPRYLVDVVDTQKMQELEQNIKDHNLELEQLMREHREVENENKQQSVLINKLNDKKRATDQELRSVHQKLKLGDNLRLNINIKNDEIDVLQNRAPIEPQIAKEEQDINKLHIDKAVELVRESQLLSKLKEMTTNACKSQIVLNHSELEMTQFRDQHQDETNALNRLQGSVRQMKLKIEEIRDETFKFKEKRDKALSKASTEVKACLESSEYPDIPLVQLQVQIVQIEKRLQGILNNGMAQDVLQYEERQKEITRLEREIEKMLGQIERGQTATIEMKQDLIGRITNMVSSVAIKFKAAMLEIDCHGDIKLDKTENPEDLESWGIDILVKFRKQEKLQSLSAFRQSGGEKSVSTMLYLMSLSADKMGFRVVDEINQGMDPRNERLVHQLIVKSACHQVEGSTQYFMITPKLLTNLEYDAQMAVHYIYTGDWIPEDGINFNNYL